MREIGKQHSSWGGRCLFYLVLILFSLTSLGVSAQDQNALDALAPGAQAPDFAVPDSFAPGDPILFFRDFALGDDVFDDALANLGLGGDVTFTDSAAVFAGLLDDQDWGCVIALNQNVNTTGTFAAALTAYVSGGGRAIFTDWTLNFSGQTGLYDAFEVAGTGAQNQQPITTDGNAIWDGVPANVGLTNPGWGIWSFGLAPVGGGVGTGTFPNGDSAVMIGNGGATAFNGFLSDTFTVTAEGIQIAENQINEICFPKVFEKLLTSGPDNDGDGAVDVVVPVKPGEALNYDFTIVYSDPESPPVLIADTLPAEWIANSVEGIPVDVDECGEFDEADGDHGMVDIYKNGKPGKKCQSATQIEWMPASVSVSLETLTKPPDVGAFWFPISNNGGTYVYSNSFVALADGAPTELGMWLRENSAGVPSLRFEVWDDTGGGAPDPSSVLATTGSVAPPVTGALEFHSAPVAAGAASLSAGSTYWFAATVVGEPFAPGSYQVGGHTQNSVYVDNGTFWFSNDPAGINFDGQGLTPEMAFEVTQETIPSLNVDSDTRMSPGKGHKEDVFAPTSCGALYLNDGAVAFEKDEDGNLVLDDDGNPIIVAGPTNAICLAAVDQDLYDALPDYSADADHDGDGLTSHEEACEIGTDPCLADTDGDGVIDGEDACPLDGDEGLGVDASGCPIRSCTMVDNFNFIWTLLLEGDGTVAAGSTIDNAYPSGTPSGSLNPEGAVALTATNDAPDGCTGFSDSFDYDGSCAAGSCGGDWTSFCFGSPLANGTWSGTLSESCVLSNPDAAAPAAAPIILGGSGGNPALAQ